MKEYKDFQAHNGLYEHNQRMDGEQWRFSFNNGYGASRETREHKGDVIGYVKDSNNRIRRRTNRPVRVWQ